MSMLLFLLALGATPRSPVAIADPRELSCVARNTSDGKDRRCHVTIPQGMTVRPCSGPDVSAGHCTAHPKQRLMAWTIATGGAECGVSEKRTDWTHRVSLKVGKNTKPGAGTCELRVVVQ